MCGRYYRLADKQRIADAFRLGQLPDDLLLPPDYNVAPTTMQPVIRLNRDTGERELVLMRWGMVPYFPKAAADFQVFSTINAKAETVTSRAMWRGPFERRRCLVPADGFYEWMKLDAKTKRPTPSPCAARCLSPSPACGTPGKTRRRGVAAELRHHHERDYARWPECGETERPPVDLLRPYEANDMTASACNPLSATRTTTGWRC